MLIWIWLRAGVGVLKLHSSLTRTGVRKIQFALQRLECGGITSCYRVENAKVKLWGEPYKRYLCCEASDCTKGIGFPACTFAILEQNRPSGSSMWARGWTEQKRSHQWRRSFRSQWGRRLHSKVNQWLAAFINNRPNTLLPQIWKPTARFKCHHRIIKMHWLRGSLGIKSVFPTSVGRASRLSRQCAVQHRHLWIRAALPLFILHAVACARPDAAAQTRLSFGGKLLPADSASCRLLQRNGLLDHLSACGVSPFYLFCKRKALPSQRGWGEIAVRGYCGRLRQCALLFAPRSDSGSGVSA